MTLAPEPYLSACLEVLYSATLVARMMGWSGEKDSAGISQQDALRLTVLMDSVHNIPAFILAWERCDETLLRRGFARYDAISAEGPKLLEIYTQMLRRVQPN